MSRIGRQPINIPSSVKVSREGNIVKVTGPKGSLQIPVRDEVGVVIEGAVIKVSRSEETKVSRQLHGLTRTLIANTVKGVTDGFEKRLEIVGVGYRAEAKDKILTLLLGYSQPMVYALPEGITVAVEKQTAITVRGADKQLVGQVTADIRALRPPEPYKGKGIKYSDEVIIRKAGKAGKAAAGGGAAGKGK
ncbi:MAG TPA: 50S ribosomal protein L6 [Thermodesulfobacteriota bacterium]|uniref:Large ribosomal subunit protein uL6 n=1 Tax=uncultured delta proteobacterium Rifle_16ft_4_minimus_10129 TaxID=1665172 RepID=A0A0H4SZW3_9DELT|nr:50S ribosomal protein L6, large subunit ribosomal protein L6 [uncultured delta proteobacterium Rifle_16ft_4_minimus_10129]HLE09339.1 50S ribosomal protein L6 [Thermodesulfobacteriota bacterium]